MIIWPCLLHCKKFLKFTTVLGIALASQSIGGCPEDIFFRRGNAKDSERQQPKILKILRNYFNSSNLFSKDFKRFQNQINFQIFPNYFITSPSGICFGNKYISNSHLLSEAVSVCLWMQAMSSEGT